MNIYEINYKNKKLYVDAEVEKATFMYGSDIDGNRGELKTEYEVLINSIRDENDSEIQDFEDHEYLEKKIIEQENE